ncbi:uncharacterized protein LOC128883580 [Hylaeus volcanicus]|uniref:uncharacterized protein LOC128883580 n=1 Tax=Hylaeus volcanicus TaxID=313075 RepID=UPI0023B7FF71|nr:uncharacterized protein LOC128883580 [Hylaeus volcanicus]
MLEYVNGKSMNFSNNVLPFSPEQSPSTALNSILSFLEWAPDRREALKQNATAICLALQIPVNNEDSNYLSNILETILQPAVGPQFFDTKNSEVFYTTNTNEVAVVANTLVPPYNNGTSQLTSQSNNSENLFHQRSYETLFDTLSTQQTPDTSQNLSNTNMSMNSSGFEDCCAEDVSAYVRTFNEMFLTNHYKLPSSNIPDISLTMTDQKPETTSTYISSTTESVNSFSMVANPVFNYPKDIKNNKSEHVLCKDNLKESDHSSPCFTNLFSNDARDNCPHDENQSNLMKNTYPYLYWNNGVSCSKDYDTNQYKEKNPTSCSVYSKKPAHTQINDFPSHSINCMTIRSKSEALNQKNFYIPIDYHDNTKSTHQPSNSTRDSYLDSCVQEAQVDVNGKQKSMSATSDLDANLSNLKKLLNFDTTIDQSTLEAEVKFVKCISYCNSVLLKIQSMLNDSDSKVNFRNFNEIENLKDIDKLFVSDEMTQDKIMRPNSYYILQKHCANFKSSLDSLKKSSMRFLESCPGEAFLYFSIQILQCFLKFQTNSTCKKNTDQNPFLVLISPIIEKLALNFNKCFQEEQHNENRTDKMSMFLHPIFETSNDAWSNKCYSSRQLTNPDTPSTRSRSSVSSNGSPKRFHKRQRRHFSKDMHHKKHLERKTSQTDMERLNNFHATLQPSLYPSENQQNKNDLNNINSLYNTPSTNSLMSSERTHNSLVFDLSDALFAENELLNRIPPHLYRDVPLRHTRCNSDRYFKQSLETLKGENNRMYDSIENRNSNGPIPKHISPRDKLLLQMPEHIITRTGVILPPLNSCLYLSKVVGVVWDRIHNSWVVNYTFLGKRYFQHFPAKKYGFLEGRQHAIELRLAKDQEKSLIEGNVRGGGRRAQGVNLQHRGSKSSWKSSLHRDTLNSQLTRTFKTSRPFRRTTKNSSCARRYRSPKKIITLKEASTHLENVNDKIDESEVSQTKSPALQCVPKNETEHFLNTSKSAPDETHLIEELNLEVSKDRPYTQQSQQQPCLHPNRSLQHTTTNITSDTTMKTSLPLVEHYTTFPSITSFKRESSNFNQNCFSVATRAPSSLTHTSCGSRPLQETLNLALDHDPIKSKLSASSNLLPNSCVSQMFSFNALQTLYTPQTTPPQHASQCPDPMCGPSALNSSLCCDSEGKNVNPCAETTCQ